MWPENAKKSASMSLRDALRAVDDDDRADAVRLFRDFLDVVFEAEHVRDLRDGDELRLFRDLGLDVLVAEVAVFLQINVLQSRALGLCDMLPRHEVAVVLGNRDDDFVSLADIREAIAVGNEVQRLCRVLREDNFFRALRVDELRRDLARVLVDFRRLDGKRIGAAMRVCITAAIVAAKRSDDLLGLLRRRAVVEVDDGLAVHLRMEEREVFEKFLWISHLRASL